jgi:hypothetical protein
MHVTRYSLLATRGWRLAAGGWRLELKLENWKPEAKREKREASSKQRPFVY